MDKIMRIYFMAFDKDSSANYSQMYGVGNKKDVDKAFKEFEANVPFPRWYYEIETDNTDHLSPQEYEEIFGEYE